MTHLRVIAAAVLKDRDLLLVSKHSAPTVHYLPGGKPEAGEAPLDCLAREVLEELGCGVVEPQLFAEVRAPAALEGVEMHMTVYLTRLSGTPAPAAEIASLVWWPTTKVALAPAIGLHVIPDLQRHGLLDAGRSTSARALAAASRAREAACSSG
jgi:8-oxo-dGTP diphosphatase